MRQDGKPIDLNELLWHARTHADSRPASKDNRDVHAAISYNFMYF